MTKLVLKYNLSCGDRVSYFHSQWKEHRLKQQAGLLTDCTLVGKDGRGKFGKVNVHQAVVMNLCPVMTFTSIDLVKEDPVFMFPDDSVEIISAFVQFLYQGFFTITQTVSVDAMLEFMSRLGLVLPARSFIIVPAPSQEKRRSDIEIERCIIAEDVSNQNLQPKTEEGVLKAEEEPGKEASVSGQLPGTTNASESILDKNVGDSDQVEINNNADNDLEEESKPKRKKNIKAIKAKSKLSVYDFDETEQKTMNLPLQATSRPRRLRARSQPLPLTEIVDKDDWSLLSAGVQPNRKLSQGTIREPRNRLKNSKYFPQDGGFITSEIDYSLPVNRRKGGVKRGRPKKIVKEKEVGYESKNLTKILEVKTRKPHATHHECMFCDFNCKMAKDLIIHCDLKHPGAVFKCPKCSYQGQCYAKLKVHQYQHKHYADVKKPVIVTPMMNTRDESEDAPVTHPSQGSKEERQKVYQQKVKGVKRKLDFGVKSHPETESEIDIIEDPEEKLVNVNEDEYESTVVEGKQMPTQELGDDFEDKITKVTVFKATSGPQLVKNMVREGPSYKVTCPVASCDTSFPVVNKDDSVEANTMMVAHQKSIHKFKESQLSYQVVFEKEEEFTPEERDSIDDLLDGNELEEAEEMANNLWRNKLSQYWTDLVRMNQELSEVEIMYEDAGEGHEDVTVVCRIGNLRIDGIGDSGMVAREDAAHNMMFLLKEISNYKDQESIVLNILGEN